MSEQSRLVYRTRDELVKRVEAQISTLASGALGHMRDEDFNAVVEALSAIQDEIERAADTLADRLDAETRASNQQVIENLRQARNCLRAEVSGIAPDDPAVLRAEEAVSCALIEAGETEGLR